jgi:exopolysaccharide production protein ExoQ
MAKTAVHPLEQNRVRSSLILDKFLLPLAACAFALILSPLLVVLDSEGPGAKTLTGAMAVRYENKIFWPAMLAITVLVVFRNRERLGWASFPPNIICLFLYLGFAGFTVLWAFRPELSSIRFAQQVMIVLSVVLPMMMAIRTADVLRGLFLCFAFACILSFFFAIGSTPLIVDKVAVGYTGHFPNKNYLGACAALALILSLYEMRHRGFRRVFAMAIAVIAVLLLFWGNSKTAMGLMLLAPTLAACALIVRRVFGVSLLTIPVLLLLLYMVLTLISNFDVYRISYYLYGESTFTGRKIIWDFVNYEIGRKPLLGWGYQSFWLVGPDAPSIVDAPGWVKTMPNGHNGYLDTIVELGYVGFALLSAFLILTVHACGRLADHDLFRGWIVLSLVVFIIISNGLESWWMRAFEFLWVLFLILAAEIGRHWVRYAPRHHRGQPIGAARRMGPVPGRAEQHPVQRRPPNIGRGRATTWDA